MKLALISSPRSGNSWLRKNLAELLGLKEFGAHNLDQLPEALPNNSILQFHWPRDERIEDYIQDQGIDLVITLHRHPLDIYLSVLRFAQVEPETLFWLNGKAKINDLIGLKPSDRKFIEYCKSKHGGKIIAISRSWQGYSGTKHIEIKYEDMIKHKVRILKKIVRLTNHRVNNLRLILSIHKTSVNNFSKIRSGHVWKASSGYWKHYFKKEDALDIYNSQKDIFEYQRYSVTMTNAKNDKIKK